MTEIVEMVGEVLFDFLEAIAVSAREESHQPSPEEMDEWNELLRQHAMYSSPERPLGILR